MGDRDGSEVWAMPLRVPKNTSCHYANVFLSKFTRKGIFFRASGHFLCNFLLFYNKIWLSKVYGQQDFSVIWFPWCTFACTNHVIVPSLFLFPNRPRNPNLAIFTLCSTALNCPTWLQAHVTKLGLSILYLRHWTESALFTAVPKHKHKVLVFP